MSNNKLKLGKGLAALIPDKNTYLSLKESNDTRYELLPIDSIEQSTLQPRKEFDEVTLMELADSIRASGVLQPILVKKSITSNTYNIIAGERRWRASKLAGLTKVPVIIKEMNDKMALEASIIENVQREDLNAIEEAEAYNYLKEKYLYTDEEIANIVGKSRTHIANFRRILGLPLNVKELIRTKKLSMGHAKILVNSKIPEELSLRIVEKGLSVRETEQLIKNEQKERIIKIKEKDKNLITLEEKLTEKLGLRVKIKDNNQIGFLTIEFKNLEELNSILKKLS